MLHRCGRESDALCPLCQERPETSKHQLQCPHPGRNDLYQDDVHALLTTLDKMDTCPFLLESLQEYLLHKGSVSFADATRQDRRLRSISTAQDRISWPHFMEGKIASAMVTYQEAYYQGTGSTRT